MHFLDEGDESCERCDSYCVKPEGFVARPRHTRKHEREDDRRPVPAGAPVRDDRFASREEEGRERFSRHDERFSQPEARERLPLRDDRERFRDNRDRVPSRDRFGDSHRDFHEDRGRARPAGRGGGRDDDRVPFERRRSDGGLWINWRSFVC